MPHVKGYDRKHRGKKKRLIQQSPTTAKDDLTNGTILNGSHEKSCESRKVPGHAHGSLENGFHAKVLKKKTGEDGKSKRPLRAGEEPGSFSMDPGEGSNINDCSTSKFARKTRKCRIQAAADGDRPTQIRTSYPHWRRGKKKKAQAQKAEFRDKYEELTQLGVGGFGSVFAGLRKHDFVPVAIKHVPKKNVVCWHADQHGKRLSAEVAIMLAFSAETDESLGISIPVTLLDWYDVRYELILVLQRPVPCEDLFMYCRKKGGYLEEKEAKIILKQVADATKYLEDKCIFHRDIKKENILIETGLDVPCARLIDFGLSCFFKKNSVYSVFYGTPKHAPPEWNYHGSYRPGPTTVWQLGVLLFEVLRLDRAFETQKFLKKKLETYIKGLSENCMDFLQRCLAINPKDRSDLGELQLHPLLKV